MVIEVASIGKRYRIGSEPRYRTLRESVVDLVKRPFAGRKRVARGDFWALREVSFTIAEGDSVAIIGPNGAGKSTLLKILSRITAPTEGRAWIRGRVGSLLEVGTGFHPELTGRENIFLNGAILGMRRGQILRRFDEIVGYAEVERFIDTPIKHYSSGMHMRLAFAVAAHLEPEVLVVDEVLAVGDAAFQRKCLGKMSDVARSGRTVLFVSHNMAAVRLLCRRGILLDAGRLVHDGSIESAIEAYDARDTAATGSAWSRTQGADQPIYFEAVTARLEGAQPRHSLALDLRLRTLHAHQPAFLAADIHDGVGGTIMQAVPVATGFIPGRSGTHRISVEVDLPPLVPGVYPVSLWVGTHNTETMDFVRSCVRFEVTASPTPDRTFPFSPDHGCIAASSRIRFHEDEPVVHA